MRLAKTEEFGGFGRGWHIPNGESVVKNGDLVRAVEGEWASTIMGSFMLSSQTVVRRSAAEVGRLLDAVTEAKEFRVAESRGFTLA